MFIDDILKPRYKVRLIKRIEISNANPRTKNKIKSYLLILLSLSLFSCTSFCDVSGIDGDHNNIAGTYLNDCDSIDDSESSRTEYYHKLWKVIDKKYESKECGLHIRISETRGGKLLAQLMRQDTVISEKLIRGHFRKNGCYYKPKSVFVLPLFPVVWGYEVKQTRFYGNPDYLIAESTEDGGGTLLLIAGGHVPS